MKGNKSLWSFAVLPNMEIRSFDNALENFYAMGVRGLVRENIQNSLDAKLDSSSGPVEVIIETGTINQNVIPGIDDVKKRILSIEGRNTTVRETIANMRKHMDSEEVKYISFEDRNTKGLTGAANGQSNDKNDTWGMYAYSKGVHYDDEDEEHERTRGGSHGVGKISSNSASDIYMMLFANCDENGDQHLGGTISLIDHEYKGKFYRGNGYFASTEKISETSEKFMPYENNFDKVFRKDTRGLKIIVPFLRKHFSNEKEIIKSVCDSFFVAILKDNLKVRVNEVVIDKDTIKKIVLSEKYYTQDLSEMREEFTPLYLKTYEIEPMEFRIKDRRKREYIFDFHFNYDENISNARVGIVRTIGMKIEDKKVDGFIRRPYNGVLIPRSSYEDEFLKSLENESHTALSSKHIKNQGDSLNAEVFIKNIGREIAKIVSAKEADMFPSDGIMDTEDVIYEIQYNLIKELEKSITATRVKSDFDENPISIISPGSTKGPGSGDKGKRNPTKRKRRNRRKKRPGKGEGVKRITNYDMDFSNVDRLVLDDSELLHMRLEEERLNGQQKCDISISIMDGEGIVLNDSFDVAENYNSVLDKNSGSFPEIDRNFIRDVEIKNGVINLALELNENFNRALTLIYNVEVEI